MNPTEHLVELYYRNCKKSFTYTDFKVEGGNNRQLDLLAYNKVADSLRHVEISVTHSTRWTANLESLKNEIRFKFFGIPKNKRPNNPKTDFNKGKTYKSQIEMAYNQFGFDWQEVIRVWCLWFHPTDQIIINNWKRELSEEFNLPMEKFEILSLRDEVLPNLMNSIGTSNYDNHILRTISLIYQQRLQTERNA
jgi:hypothetical protein